MNKLLSILVILQVIYSCQPKEGSLFKNASPEKSGLDFVNQITETDDLNILDYLYFYNGGGVAVGDLNNDGLPEVFLTGNQVENKLYLNQGNLKFKDISDSAAIKGNSSWNTGAVMGDVNGDGLLDIYVCAVVGLNGFNGHNELYINNGDLTFSESSQEYGLDMESYSSTAAFLDYDLDGDLDLYILNHAVHTQESFGKAELRNKRNYETGDKLMRNDDGKFTDVSEEAGIFGGLNGYGLSVAVSDFNHDGFPDIYVSNDFHEDDYYYINQGDGTFKEELKKYFGHTTRFSMGNDVADINHDGWPDILTLDMLPEDETVLKSSDGDEALQILKLRVEHYGYHYQFTRNMLQINQPGAQYVETALLSGIAATDWSWSGLFEDFDQDGHLDLFVSNGIPKRPNNLDFIKFISNDQIQKKINNSRLVDQKAIDMMPHGKVPNYIFQGNESIDFKDRSGDWMIKDSLISGASALGDLDGDGDMDLVVNNINNPVSIYVNKTDGNSNYLSLDLRTQEKNQVALGTKVFSYHKGQLQYKELYTVRGFQASSQPIIHFGYGETTSVDSLRIIWPDKTTQLLTNVSTNQLLSIRPENTVALSDDFFRIENEALFSPIEDKLGLQHRHIENNYNDFNVTKLIPYQVSDRGPATAIGDLNNDGKEDVFFGGSRKIGASVYLQKDNSFEKENLDVIDQDSIYEDVAAIIEDLNGDGSSDLYIGTGGADLYQNAYTLLDNFYSSTPQGLLKSSLPEFFENASVIKPYDIDQDGDLDLFVGAHVVSKNFGQLPSSHILINDGGSFSKAGAEVIELKGMITDACWVDLDNNGFKDLMVVGEWMAPRLFMNSNGQLKEISLSSTPLNGLWQAIEPFDIDGDGDLDLLLGNWGSNNKYVASDKFPMKMHHLDFDGNRKSETIISIEKEGIYYPLKGLDELSSQMNRLKRKFTSYKEFAGKPLDQVIDKKLLDSAEVHMVHELRSGYLKNEEGKFTFVPFNWELQVAPITCFKSYDFDNDQKNEVLAAGNYFGIKPFHGRFDGFSGALIKNEQTIVPGYKIGLTFQSKSARHLDIVHLGEQPYLLATFNNDSVQVYGLQNYQQNSKKRNAK